MSIQDTLAAAAAEAAKTPAQGTAVAEAPGSAVAAVTPGRRLSITDLKNDAGGAVATYLKVSQHGLTIGKEATKLVESFPATIDLSDAKICRQTRFGNPAQYFKSYDGVTTAGSGRPWTETLRQAKAADPSKSSDPFITAELIIVASEDVVSVKGEKVADAGTKIGYTPPYTGADAFIQLLKAVREAGGDDEKSVVNVKVGYIPQSRGGNNWGIVTYEFVSLVS